MQCKKKNLGKLCIAKACLIGVFVVRLKQPYYYSKVFGRCQPKINKKTPTNPIFTKKITRQTPCYPKVAYLRFLPPCTALNLGLVLQMTNVRPRRRTTWQSSWRVLADLSELKTCMGFSFKSKIVLLCYNIFIQKSSIFENFS